MLVTEQPYTANVSCTALDYLRSASGFEFEKNTFYCFAAFILNELYCLDATIQNTFYCLVTDVLMFSWIYTA